MKIKVVFLLLLLFFILLSPIITEAATVSVCNMASSISAQVRIYNITTITEVVAWTNTGVTERVVGMSKSCYYYNATLTSGQAYQIDWRNSATPTQIASEYLYETDTGIAAIKIKTDQLVFTITNQVDANALTGGGGDVCFITGTAQVGSTVSMIVDTINLVSNQANAYTGMVVEVGGETAIVKSFNSTTDTITLATNLSSEPDNNTYCLIRDSVWEILNKIRTIRR